MGNQLSSGVFSRLTSVFGTNSSRYTPLCRFRPLIWDEAGVLRPNLSTDDVAPYRTNEELLADKQISREQVEQVLAPVKARLLVVGNSNFRQEGLNRYFRDLVDGIFNHVFSRLRRVGIIPGKDIALMTSATAGQAVDKEVREVAFR